LCISTGYSDITAPPSGSRLKPPNSGDRFIPLRSSTTLKLGNYKVINTMACVKHTGCSGCGPTDRFHYIKRNVWKLRSKSLTI